MEHENIVRQRIALLYHTKADIVGHQEEATFPGEDGIDKVHCVICRASVK